MKATSAVRVVHVANVITTIAAFVVVSVMALTFFDFATVTQLAGGSRDLSNEMRFSIDELTRFVRTYTVTGNRTYEDLYRAVLDMREGKARIPAEPHRIWWDLVVCCGVSRPTDPPKPLIRRMVEAGFEEKELEHMQQALQVSDELVRKVEAVAFAARRQFDDPRDRTFFKLLPTELEREMWFRTHSLARDPKAPRREDFAKSAVTSVHGQTYAQLRGDVMRPIDRFAETVFKRVEGRLESIAHRGYILVGLQLLVIALIILTQVLFVMKISRDAAASSLLSTVLPGRIVDRVSLGKFRSLRRHAVVESRKRGVVRGGEESSLWGCRNTSSTPGGPENATERGHHFPTLFTEFIPCAWVTFLDVVSFTPTCREASAAKVIGMLNELFSLLDLEASYAGVEKIKTIGDAFLAVVLHHTGSDNPTPSSTIVSEIENTPDAAEGGMQMLTFLFRAFKAAEGVARPKAVLLPDGTWSSLVSLRAGLHAGPVAAGIVGFERPLYDVFGDTVNVAARLEAMGQATSVIILTEQLRLFREHTKHLLYSPSPRRVHLKGVGEVDTTLIHGDDREGMLRSTTAVLLHAPRTRLSGRDFTSVAPSAPHSVLQLAAAAREVVSEGSDCSSDSSK